MSKTDRTSMQSQPVPARADAIRPRARLRLATAFGVVALLLTGSAAAQSYVLQRQFSVSTPSGIAIDPATSNILVAEGSNQVQVFNFAGGNLGRFGSFTGAAAVAVDSSSGNVWVSDGTLSAGFILEMCSPSGVTYGNCTYFPGPAGGMGIAIDPVSHNLVAIADKLAFLQICPPPVPPNPNYLCHVVDVGQGQPYAAPKGVAIDPVSHNIVVVDNGTNLVRIYSPTGIYLSTVGGNGQFSEPYAVAIDPTTRNIVVSQWGAAPYNQIFDSSGNYVGWFGSVPTWGVAIDPASGDIATISTYQDNNIVQIFAPAPTVTESLSPSTVYNTAPATTMTIKLDNTKTATVTGVAFDDVYPAGIANASSNVVLANSCGGTITATPGGSFTQLSNGWIPPNSSCSIVIGLVGSKFGNWVNPTGAVTSTGLQISGEASASLRVLAQLPVKGPIGQGSRLPGN